MTSTTAAFYDVIFFDGRAVNPGAYRRVIRFVGGHIVTGLGAVAAVGLLVTTVTLAAAWLVNSTLSANPHLHARASMGPGALALVKYDPRLTGAADTSFAAKWTDLPASMQVSAMPRPLAITDSSAKSEIARAPDLTQVAKLTPAAHPARTSTPSPKAAPERSNRVPLPRSHPAQRDIARVPAGRVAPHVALHTESQVAATAAPLVATVTPPAATAEKHEKPQQAHNKSMALPDPDSRTAVYDIAAHTVYLPNGEKLEAHSGLGDKMDDPRYFKVRMRGVTPPNVYDLTMREQLFHGVRAIRLNPVDKSKMHGRAGMLAHTYMLGPNGQSNGCVSFKDYRKFLQAFLDGKVDRLVVVPELGNTSWRVAARQGGERGGPARRYAANSEPVNYSPVERSFATW